MAVTPTRSHPTLLPMTFDLCVHWLTCCLFFLFFTFRLDRNMSSNYVSCSFYAHFIHGLYIFSNFLSSSSHFSLISSLSSSPLVFSPLVLALYTLCHPFASDSIPPHIPSSFTPLVFFVSLGRQSSLCSPYDIIQCRLQPVYATVQVLVALDSASLDRKRRETVVTSNAASSRGSKCRSLVSVTTQTPPPAWQIWDLIGSSLLHILCLTLLFVAYSWIELT